MNEIIILYGTQTLEIQKPTSMQYYINYYLRFTVYYNSRL